MFISININIKNTFKKLKIFIEFLFINCLRYVHKLLLIVRKGLVFNRDDGIDCIIDIFIFAYIF